MYYRAFGLTKSPFSLTPDPAFFFLTPQHREALVGLIYGIQCKGFIALLGEAGTGKTTLLAKALQLMPSDRLQSSAVLHPTLTPAEFLEMVLLDFGVRDVPASKAQRLWRLQQLLFDARRSGKLSALIVDEAHKLSPEVLEELRLLGNLEQADRKLLQILLIGQDELDDCLNRVDMRQLKQRIALRLHIGPLDPNQVGPYIQHRWSVAGGSHAPFLPQAVGCIATISHGIPRLVNSLCENALSLALADGLQNADARHVTQAAGGLRLIEASSVSTRQAPDPVNEGHPDLEKDELEGEETPRTTWTRWASRLGLSAGGGVRQF